ncbi:hypothetical protein [Nocardioides jensenii]|uniref:hypothetical protein n=1 Tax=Nocardioides jensenii TaxID=1843 RepID=UPI000AC217AC|nr:hypothetical protein [Nocardioides jensenii]
MRARLLRSVVAATVSVGLLVTASPTSGQTTWTRVGTGITQGISGIAPAASGWVIVRDNKTSGQNRVALLSDTHVVRNLTWPGTAPSDLEAIGAVPAQAGRYAVVTSSGSGRVISISGTTLRVIRAFTLPAGRLENESFALTRVGSTTVAVWANRGSTTTAGGLFAATFNVSRGTFGRVVRADVTVPWPTTNVRPISDATVLSGGRIVISSASDNGNNGPFDAALYAVGTVSLSSGQALLTMTGPVALGTHPGHKIEGLACKGTAGILGTDDENLGGWVAAGAFCS